MSEELTRGMYVVVAALSLTFFFFFFFLPLHSKVHYCSVQAKLGINCTGCMAPYQWCEALTYLCTCTHTHTHTQQAGDGCLVQSLASPCALECVTLSSSSRRVLRQDGVDLEHYHQHSLPRRHVVCVRVCKPLSQCHWLAACGIGN